MFAIRVYLLVREVLRQWVGAHGLMAIFPHEVCMRFVSVFSFVVQLCWSGRKVSARQTHMLKDFRTWYRNDSVTGDTPQEQLPNQPALLACRTIHMHYFHNKLGQRENAFYPGLWIQQERQPPARHFPREPQPLTAPLEDPGSPY